MVEKTASIGIDIGGTKISAAIVRDEQIIGRVFEYKTPDNLEDIQDTVLEAVDDVLSEYNDKVTCVGIATAGTVNNDNSKVTGSTGNLPAGYNTINFPEIIQSRFGLNVFLENDANAAAYAEYKVGNAKGDNNTVVITVGTGIGGGVIINGKLLRGKSGGAGELGHIPININNDRKCTCGIWNCWEAYASGTGYAKTAREMILELTKEEQKQFLQGKSIQELNTYDMINALKSSDPFAIKVHEYWENLILIGLVTLVNIFDPDSIIISGGMAKFINFDKLLQKLKEQVLLPDIKLLPAKSGNNAGIIGAGILASEKYQ